MISMLKIRRPLGRLIFNMGIAIPGKTVFLIETAPSAWGLLWAFPSEVNGQKGRSWACLTKKYKHLFCGDLQVKTQPSPEIPPIPRPFLWMAVGITTLTKPSSIWRGDTFTLSLKAQHLLGLDLFMSPLMGLLPDTQNCGLRMRVNDPDMHHGTCMMHAWIAN